MASLLMLALTPSPPDDERDARRVGLAGNGLYRLRIGFRRAHAVGNG